MLESLIPYKVSCKAYVPNVKSLRALLRRSYRLIELREHFVSTRTDSGILRKRSIRFRGRGISGYLLDRITVNTVEYPDGKIDVAIKGRARKNLYEKLSNIGEEILWPIV